MGATVEEGSRSQVPVGPEQRSWASLEARRRHRLASRARSGRALQIQKEDGQAAAQTLVVLKAPLNLKQKLTPDELHEGLRRCL